MKLGVAIKTVAATAASISICTCASAASCALNPTNHHGVAFLGPPKKSASTISSWKRILRPYSTTRPSDSKSYQFNNPLQSTTDDNEQETISLPEIKLYNSLTRTKTPLVPLSPPKVTMYTCGPTVYDSAHVGNFRAFLTYDVLKRVLLYLGYDVDHVCNLTDVDDKIIKRCDREGISLIELTRKYEEKFFEDLEALNIVKANVYPRATEHIDEMAKFIFDLERNGLAYRSEEGSWYFSVSKKEGYGTRLVQLDPEQLKIGASAETGGAGAQRGALDADEYDSEKEGVRDFCLWKAFKPEFDREDGTWNPVVEMEDGTTREIGRGRPGWHLECSAMARKYLGNTIDLHAGGVDLKFPHHENEIAQSEGANCAPFCSCWVHNGFVNIGDEKMSKSKGNFLTLRGACPTADDVRAYRYLVVSSQYRNPLSFTEAALSAAKGALKRLDKVKAMMAEALDKGEDTADTNTSESAIIATVDKELANFELAIVDDLSMPRASACLFSIVKAAEKEFKRVDKTKKDGEESADAALDLAGLKRAQHALDQMDQVFGIFYNVPACKDLASSNDEGPTSGEDAAVPEDIMELVMQRSKAKEAKDFELADSLRAKITELGFSVKDVKDGDPVVSRI
ncbi:hypothetical protein HJC23_000095 [Cyclotella cryptica]|uniref:Cysteine--tRNA ligase n=1 Tax=Cyclotella cryptica TaxID=29204 RepID=A0ABD3P757_9STRA|eukprot:CCRYP_017164-RA/>CCRYP_017164-RA protein AED:0.02 eAED:0.02 QI:160/1/1/1/0.5/0.33/3/91/624